MADFTESTDVDADDQALFAYLSDVSNLPQYFSRMTQASPGDGEKIHTKARMPDGHEEQGDAWFRVLTERQRVEWGSEGDSDYHGHLDVESAGAGSRVEVHLHTERVQAGDEQIREGLKETLSNIKRLVEAL